MIKSKKHQRKVQGSFVYKGFGFPVVLVNVPMVKVRGSWTPNVNYDEISQRLLEALALKPSKLTGGEVRFIRHMVSMTLEQFGERFGVTHPAVVKWERSGRQPTAMTWAVEKDIRLEVLQSRSGAKKRDFLSAYRELAKIPVAKQSPIRLKIDRPA